MSSVNNNLSQFGQIDKVDALKKVIALKLHGLTIAQLNEVLFNINALLSTTNPTSNSANGCSANNVMAAHHKQHQSSSLADGSAAIVGGVQLSNQVLYDSVKEKQALTMKCEQLEQQLQEVQHSNQQLIKQLNSKKVEGAEDVQP